MDHSEAQSLFADYFAGRLDRQATRALHGHFKECEICRTRIRLERAQLLGGRGPRERAPGAPDIQAQMARNRDLLIKILLVMIAAYFVYKMKR